MALDIGKLADKAWSVAKEIIARTAYSEAAGIPGIHKEIEKQKTKVGKDVLWTAFPVMLIGVLAFIAIKKF